MSKHLTAAGVVMLLRSLPRDQILAYASLECGDYDLKPDEDGEVVRWAAVEQLIQVLQQEASTNGI